MKSADHGKLATVISLNNYNSESLSLSSPLSTSYLLTWPGLLGSLTIDNIVDLILGQ